MAELLAFSHRISPQSGAAEAAALERAASGIRDALGAQSVYGALLEGDGAVRFRASAPVDAGIPAPWKPGDIEGLAEALDTGVVTHLSGVPPLFGPAGPVVVMPLTSRAHTFGAMVMSWDPGTPVPDSPVLALVGSQLGLALDALRHCGTLSQELAMHGEAAALLDCVLEIVPEAVKVLDLDGRVLHWNPACERLYGWSAGDVRGERMPHVPEDMRLRAIQDIRRIAAGGQEARRESFGMRNDGSQIPLGITVAPFADRDGHPAGVVSVVSELTGEHAISAPGEALVSVVAQSLRGPLTAIVGFAQLLARPEILEDEGRRSRTIRALEERGTRMAALVDDLLLATRPGQEGIRLDAELADLAGMVMEVVSSFEEEHPEYRFVVDYDASIAPMMLDRRRIQQALGNLLDAALRSSSPGSDIALAVRFDEGDAVVEITGGDPGVESEESERPPRAIIVAKVMQGAGRRGGFRPPSCEDDSRGPRRECDDIGRTG